MRFKLLFTAVVLGVLTGGAALFWRHTAQERIQSYLDRANIESSLLKTSRDIPEDIEIGAYLAGNEALRHHDYLAAESFYEKVLAADSQNKEVRLKVFVTSALNGNISRALALANTLKGEDNFLVEHFILADMIRQNKYKEALDYIESGQAKTISHVFKQLSLAWIYAGLEEKGKAFAALEEIPEELNWVKVQHRAMLHAYFGEITASKETISLFASTDIPVIDLWYYITRILSFSEIKENEALFQKLLDAGKSYVLFAEIVKQSELMRPFSPQIGFANALYLMYISLESNGASNEKAKNQGQTEDALIFINAAAYMDEFSIYQILAADLSRSLNMHKQALSVYDSLLKYPRPPQTVEWLKLRKAETLEKLHRFKAAYRLFYQMMNAGTKNPWVYHHLIDISSATGKYDDALLFADKLVSLVRNNISPKAFSHLLAKRAAIHYNLNDKKAMEADLLEALEHDSENVEALNSLGYEWIESGKNVQEGLKMALKANELSPKSAYILDSVAWGYYISKDYENALKYGKESAKNPHDSAIIEMHLGDIYQALNKNMEAQAQYRKALTIKKDLSKSDKKRLKLFLNELSDEKVESDSDDEENKPSKIH